MRVGLAGRVATAVVMGLSALVAPVLPFAGSPVAAEVSGPLERSDAASAAALARQVGQPVLVTGLHTETSDTAANPDGSFSSRFFTDPVRIRRGTGWADIDTTLHRNGDGSVSPAATASELTFSGGGGGAAIRLVRAGKELALWWPSVLPAPTLSGDTATYPDVLPSVDLQLRARPDGFGQLLVVKDRVGAANAALRSIRWQVAATGLTVRDDGDGRFSVVDAAGTPVWFAPESYMWDSSVPAAAAEAVTFAGVDPSAGLRQARLGVAVDAASVTVTPDAGMLADPATVFPLYIDPELIAYSTSWTHVNKGSPNTSYWSSVRDSMRVGMEYGTPANVWRTIVRVGIGSITNQGQQIIAAQFRTLLDHSASCSPTSVDL